MRLGWVVAAAGIAVAGACWRGLAAGSVSPAGRAALGVAALAVGLWASELLPMPLTAILAMLLLSITGAARPLEAAFVGFSSPILFFLLGSAAIGIAAEQTLLADRLAGWLLDRSRGSGRLVLRDLLLSMPLQALIVPSAISRNAVLVPIYQRVLTQLGHPARLGAAVMLTLGVLGPIASSTLLTGGTSPVAASQALGGFTWISWFVAVGPPYYVLLAAGGLVVWVVARPESVVTRDETLAVTVPSGVRRAEWTVAVVSAATSLLWVMDGITHWQPAIPALLALVVLLIPGIGVMSWGTFATRAPWGICIVLAWAVSLGGALSRTGAAAWMARGLFGHFALPGSAPLRALMVFLVTAVITLAIPNRAAAITLCIPLATAFAASGSLSRVAAGLVVMIAVDAEAIYPAQTAANLLAFDTGYFNGGQLARFNLITLTAAAAVAAFVALPWWSLVGLPGGP